MLFSGLRDAEFGHIHSSLRVLDRVEAKNPVPIGGRLGQGEPVAQPATSHNGEAGRFCLVRKRKACRGMPEGPTDEPLKAQLRSDSGRSSKVIEDRQGIEAVVEVPGVGELMLRVDSAGGFLLRGRPKGEEGEGEEAARQVLLDVGVMRADGIVAVHPEESPTTPPSTTSSPKNKT